MGEQLEESLQKSLFVLQKHVFQMIITLPQKKKKKKTGKSNEKSMEGDTTPWYQRN